MIRILARQVLLLATLSPTHKILSVQPVNFLRSGLCFPAGRGKWDVRRFGGRRRGGWKWEMPGGQGVRKEHKADREARGQWGKGLRSCGWNPILRLNLHMLFLFQQTSSPPFARKALLMRHTALPSVGQAREPIARAMTTWDKSLNRYML